MRQKYSDMTPLDIRIAIMRAGKTQAEIARTVAEDGRTCSKEMVRRVIDGHSVSHRVRLGIAEATGIPVQMIWRSYYLNYTPCRRGRRVSGSSRRTVRSVAA